MSERQALQLNSDKSIQAGLSVIKIHEAALRMRSLRL